MPRSTSCESGLTLVEILIAALIGVVVAGGTMLAFTTAKKTSIGAAGAVEAADLAQQTLEKFRNKIACDDPVWFNASTCAATVSSAWTTDSLPSSPGLLSIIGLGGSTRDYRVTSVDCDGTLGAGDCFKVEARVRWTPRQ